MKRFLLFAGEHYYPKPGALDLYGSFDTVEEAKAALETADIKGFGRFTAKHIESGDIWWQVLDHETGKIVAGSDFALPDE